MLAVFEISQGQWCQNDTMLFWLASQNTPLFGVSSGDELLRKGVDDYNWIVDILAPAHILLQCSQIANIN